VPPYTLVSPSGLFNTFGLWRERPHELQGLRARLAARVALHNCENVHGDDLWPV
jgi:hypothetical protein